MVLASCRAPPGDVGTLPELQRSRIFMTEQQNDWLALWQRASQARASGRISRALELFPVALATSPRAAEPYREAASLGLDLSANLAGVGRLYRSHCADLRLRDDECPARASHERLMRDMRYSVVGNLLAALKFNAQSPTVQLQTARALHAVGRTDLAWPHLWSAIKLGPNCYQDTLDTGWLVATFDGIEDANVQFERLTKRWRSDATALLVRTNANENAGRPTGFPAANAQPEQFEHVDLVEIADDLVGLARSALVLRLPERSEALLPEILDAAARLATQLPDYAPAHLAEGLAALGVGDARRARRCFATGSLLCEQAGLPAKPPAVIDKLTVALATARSFLLNPAAPSIQQDMAPSIDGRLLKLIHARVLRTEGDAFAALDLCGDAVAEYFVRQPPISYEFYRGYKILAHDEHYYAVPRSVREFTIVDGVICKPSRVAQYARFRLPRWVIVLLRRLAGRAGRATWSLLRAFRRRLYAVPGVKIADDFEALRALIDQSEGVSRIERSAHPR